MEFRESQPLAASPPGGIKKRIKRARRKIRKKLKNCGPNSRCGSPSGIGAKIKATLSGVGTGNRKPMKNKASKRYSVR